MLEDATATRILKLISPLGSLYNSLKKTHSREGTTRSTRGTKDNHDSSLCLLCFLWFLPLLFLKLDRGHIQLFADESADRRYDPSQPFRISFAGAGALAISSMR